MLFTTCDHITRLRLKTLGFRVDILVFPGKEKNDQDARVRESLVSIIRFLIYKQRDFPSFSLQTRQSCSYYYYYYYTYAIFISNRSAARVIRSHDLAVESSDKGMCASIDCSTFAIKIGRSGIRRCNDELRFATAKRVSTSFTLSGLVTTKLLAP